MTALDIRILYHIIRRPENISRLAASLGVCYPSAWRSVERMTERGIVRTEWKRNARHIIPTERGLQTIKEFLQ